MAELDKKIQKAQTDLVQSVLEAQEKRNSERVDMLITNAIKQLKMSRFKPDQSTCLALTYLARVSPRIFHQSNTIKDLLKSLIRRDNGPANIKGKSDILVPILSANILLASCDSPDIRLLILQKIEQWLTNNQRLNELVQHLLATLCMKSQSDQQTIGTLIDMRHHWLQYLNDNIDAYGPIPADLCSNIRRLMRTGSDCNSLLEYLEFLSKHDTDIYALCREVSRFIIERPISLGSMLNRADGQGRQLVRMFLRIFLKLIDHLKSQPSALGTRTSPEPKESEPQKLPTESKSVSTGGIKSEVSDSNDNVDSEEAKPDTKMETDEVPNQHEPTKREQQVKTEDSNDQAEESLFHRLYVKLPNFNQIVAMDKIIVDAIITLFANENSDEPTDRSEEYNELLNCWLAREKVDQAAGIFVDFSQKSPYNIPDKLRQELINSPNDSLVELGLSNASVGQLIRLLHQFGSSVTTINKILKRIDQIRDAELIKSEIRDFSYFNELMTFYNTLGSTEAQRIYNRLNQALA